MKLEKINIIWPKIGGFLALLITITMIILWISDNAISVLVIMYWLNLAILMFHEFEEYVFPGGFKTFINTKTVLSLPEPNKLGPISEGVIIVINLGIWVVFIIAALLATIAPWLGLSMVIFNIVNIVGHLLIFQKKVRGYNPGMITAILMIPFLIFVFVIVINQDLITPLEYIVAGIIGFVSGISLPIYGSIIRKKELLKHQ
ncbi:MAG: HXXEE domain-containing protein [Promethearchaeota archaeon]